MKNIITIFLIMLLAVQLIALEKASDFKLENIEGKQVKLSDFQKEGLVILDFWATWCVPCKNGLPKLNELHKKYKNVNVLAICTDKPRKKAAATSLIKSSKYEFHTLFDLKKVVQKQFNITNIPRTIIVDQDGTIIYDHTGYQRGDEKHYEEVIIKWLESKENDDIYAVEKIKITEKKEISKQSFPPDLYIENLIFIEPSNNRALDGLENGNIQFDIVNKGRGDAININVNITPLTSSQNISFPTKTEIKKVFKSSRKKISIPISASIDVKSLSREFRIELTESNGFDADPAKISFETLAFTSPNLKIEQIAIDDNQDAEGEGFSYGNGNAIIEPNESIEVTVYVQNFGEGVASDVKAKVILTSDNQDITCPDVGKYFNLGDIKSGDYRKIEFYFYTSRRYDEENIPLSVELSENTGIFGKTTDLGLKLGDRTKAIIDIQVTKIHKQKEIKMKEFDNIAVLSDVDKNIPKTEIDGKNTLAIVIGIENYKYAPTVDFALNDARVFYQYSKSVFGIPERNIYYRTNDGATSGEFNKIFAEDGWISRRLEKGQTDVIVYYSGHGAPDTKSEKGYLIPFDIDPNYANTGSSLDFIYTSLSKLQAKSVTLFIDACFSGVSRSEEMLIAGIRPISVKIKNPILTTENMAVFSASTDKQYSSAYPEKQHGLFTYYLLKGLMGEAKGSDKNLTLDELQNYIYKNVSQTAGYLDKEQSPTFIGKNMYRVLIKY